jgi:hypothetical protein
MEVWKSMFRETFEILDAWIGAENRDARVSGFMEFAKCDFWIVGQVALLIANMDIQIAKTGDLDAFSNAKYAVLAELKKLLAVINLELETLHDEIWMPPETVYLLFFEGDFVTVHRAEPEYVMVSKAKYALAKNKILLQQYIASSPPEIFFEMCQKYRIDVENILEE